MIDGPELCDRKNMGEKGSGVIWEMKPGIVCLVVAICSCLIFLTANAESIQIATFHYPPVMDSSQPNGGLMGDIVHAAFQEVNIESELVYFPAKRVLLNYIGTEAYIACIGPVVLVDRQPEDRKQHVIRIPPLVDILMVFAYHKPTHGKKPIIYERLTDFSGLKVGAILGSNTTPLLQGAGIEVTETHLDSQMKLLKANRIDFAAVGLLTGMDLIRKTFPTQEGDFAFIRKPIMELPTSIYFNRRFPKSDEYAEQFLTGLDSMVENGQYVLILENYYGEGQIPPEYKPLFRTLGVQYPF